MRNAARALAMAGTVLVFLQPLAGARADALTFADRYSAAHKGSGFAMEGYFVWCGSVLKVDGSYQQPLGLF